jgi:hypothetical protein
MGPADPRRDTGAMRIPWKPRISWKGALAAAVAVAVVFTAGYAEALGNQQQGTVTKLYVTSAPNYVTSSTAWIPVPGLLISGTWKPGQLLVAHLDGDTACVSESGALGACRVFIGLTGPDAGAPNIEMQPLGAGQFAMDSTLVNPATEWVTQSHALTRYLTVPPSDPASGTSTPFVWVEVEVSNPGIAFTLQMPVLTVTVVNPTVT